MTHFSSSLKTRLLPRPISWKLPLKLLSGTWFVKQCLSDQRDMVNEGGVNISCECAVERGAQDGGFSKETLLPQTPVHLDSQGLPHVLGTGESGGQGKALYPFQKENNERGQRRAPGDSAHSPLTQLEEANGEGRSFEGNDF